MTIRDLLGLEHPIVQAPMAGSQGSRLAIAVSHAGGLGSLPCAMLSLETLRAELGAVRAATDMPFNVNFFCHEVPVADQAREDAWRALLAPYYRECGLDASAVAPAPGRLPFSAAIADAIAPFRPPVVSFHFGLPSRDLVTRVKSWGAKVISTATTIAEAQWLEAHGVDAIIAQGAEAGGHRGMFLTADVTEQVGTMALVPQLVRRARVPVIAAGGIADARGVAAAMALGAAGVQVGTAFLLCPEATTGAVHRAALQGDGARHTAVTNLFTGRPARGIVNRLMREIGPLNAAAPAFPLAANALAPLRAHAEARSEGAFSPLWCGQNATGCRPEGAADILGALAALC